MATAITSTRWLRAVDLFLYLAVLGVPICLGGRGGWGQLLLISCAAGASLAWIGGRVSLRISGYRWSRAEPLLLAGTFWLVLQLVPLPSTLLHSLSPTLADWLPSWTAESLGTWSTLSLYPAATTEALCSVIAVGLLFAVACQRLRTINDVETMLKVIGLATAAMAAFALIQFATSNGRFFWFYDHPFTSTLHRVKGTFTNKNHFAHFMALGLAPLAWWLVRRVGQKPGTGRDFTTLAQKAGSGDLVPGVVMCGLGLVVFAGLLSLSRGGALALGVAASSCAAMMYRHQQVSGRLLAGLATSAVLVATCLGFYGFQDVSQRLEEWDPGVRLMVWDANLQVASKFPWTGTGLGTHVEAHPTFLSEPFRDREFTHAENSPVQVASETGLPGLLMCLTAIFGCLTWCQTGLKRGTDPRVATAAAAVTASLLAHLVHCLFDFLWYVPGCMVVVVLLVACARSLATMATADEMTDSFESIPETTGGFRRIGWMMAATVIVLATGFGIQQTGQRIAGDIHWDEYLRLRFPKETPADPDTVPTPAEYRTAARKKHQQRMIALGRTITANPNHARAHLRLAAHYVTMVEELRTGGANPHMPLGQIRQAALGAGFDSDAERSEWLSRPGVLGAHRRHLGKAFAHARQSLALCPLQGMGYVHLAQLGYLNGDTAAASNDLIAQALVIRPHQARVHEAAGSEAWLVGGQKTGLAHWKRAFHLDRVVQRRILKKLAAAGLPAQVIIREFQPDWESLVYMKELYKKALPADEYRIVLADYAVAAQGRATNQDGTDAVTSWLLAAGAYRQLDQSTQVQACYENALEENPASLTARLAFGRWLYSQDRFTEAVEHLEWASQQQPDNQKLQRLLSSCRNSASGDQARPR